MEGGVNGPNKGNSSPQMTESGYKTGPPLKNTRATLHTNSTNSYYSKPLSLVNNDSTCIDICMHRKLKLVLCSLIPSVPVYPEQYR